MSYHGWGTVGQQATTAPDLGAVLQNHQNMIVEMQREAAAFRSSQEAQTTELKAMMQELLRLNNATQHQAAATAENIAREGAAAAVQAATQVAREGAAAVNQAAGEQTRALQEQIAALQAQLATLQHSATDSGAQTGTARQDAPTCAQATPTSHTPKEFTFPPGVRDILKNLPRFGDDRNDFLTFLHEFEYSLQVVDVRWDNPAHDYITVRTLMLCFKGKKTKELGSLLRRPDCNTYAGLRAALIARYVAVEDTRAALKTLQTMRKAAGTSMRDHCATFRDLLATARSLGQLVPEEQVVDMFLDSVPKALRQHYNPWRRGPPNLDLVMDFANEWASPGADPQDMDLSELRTKLEQMEVQLQETRVERYRSPKGEGGKDDRDRRHNEERDGRYEDRGRSSTRQDRSPGRAPDGGPRRRTSRSPDPRQNRDWPSHIRVTDEQLDKRMEEGTCVICGRAGHRWHQCRQSRSPSPSGRPASPKNGMRPRFN